ncbi:MAG: iron-containing alcohol dehydrogenase [Motiliproteus sp.]
MFVFNTTPSVICGAGSLSQTGQLVGDMGTSRVLVVTDPGIVKLGLLDKLEASLIAAGIEFRVFSGVQPDPSEAVVLQALSIAREQQVGAVIGIGGGSSMDVAKLVALLAQSEQTLEQIYGVGLAKGRRLPLIQIPTTSGTGSEVTPISIITTGANEKKGVVSPLLLPDVALLDVTLTLGLPPGVTAATGIDAMIHAIEAYTSRHRKNPLSDSLARQALALLSANISTAVHQGDNLAAREQMLLGSMLAGQAFANAPVAAVHALAYPLGGHFHIPHGLSNSLVLPHVMRFNAPACAPLYAELAQIIDPAIATGLAEVMTQALIDSIERLIETLGLPTRLRDMKISRDQLPMLANDAMEQQRLLVNNPREVTYEDALAIYQNAY